MKLGQIVEQTDDIDDEISITIQQNRTNFNTKKIMLTAVVLVLAISFIYQTNYHSLSQEQTYSNKTINLNQFIQASKLLQKLTKNQTNQLPIIQNYTRIKPDVSKLHIPEHFWEAGKFFKKQVNNKTAAIIKYTQKLQNIRNDKLKTQQQNTKIYLVSWDTKQLQMVQYNSSCLLLNSVQMTSLDQEAIDSQLNLGKKVQKVIWIFSNHRQADVFSQILFQKSIQSGEIIQKNIDSTYNFILQETTGCKIIIFGRVQFIFKNTISLPYQQATTVDGLIFSPPVNSFNTPETIINNQTDISKIPRQQMTKYILFFPVNLLHIITPVNFAIYNQYTLTEIISFPLITFFAHSQQLKLFPIQYSIKASLLDSILFSFNRLQMNSNHLCFVNYPYNLQVSNQTDFIKYVKPFRENKQQNISIITTLVYLQSQSLLPFIKTAMQVLLAGVNIKIKIRSARIMIALELYDSAFTYCPASSTIFSTRHNINFLPRTFKDKNIRGLCIPSETSVSTHLIIPIIFNDKNGKKSQHQHIPIVDYQHKNPLLHYSLSLSNGQIFCEQLIRSINITHLKWQLTEFYESDYPVYLMMLQRAKNNYINSNVTYFQRRYVDVNHLGQFMKKQESIGLQYRLKMLQMDIRSPNILVPQIFNPLSNRGYRRNATDVIPRIIHQITINQQTKIQKTLSDILMAKHSTFQYRLWDIYDVIQSQFPITFSLLQILLDLYTSSKTRYLEQLTISIMKLEILYHYGGIYVDMNYEVKKSLSPFLKFEYFCLNKHNGYKEQYKNSELQTDFIGSIKNSQNILLVLTEFILPEHFEQFFKDQNNRQNLLLTPDLLLFYAFSAENLATDMLYSMDLMKRFKQGQFAGPCHFIQAVEQDEQVFQIKYKNQTTKIVVPCRYSYELYSDYYYQLSELVNQ